MPRLPRQIVFDNMRAARLPEGAPLADVRAYIEGMARVFRPLRGVDCLARQYGDVPVELQQPHEVDAGHAMMYLHGGGYCFGSPASHRHVTTRLAKWARCPVWSVDYRLAPEHPFPAGLDDARAVYRAMLDAGLDPSDITVAGDSAGGGMALSLLAVLRNEGAPMPAACAALSPWTDLAATGTSFHEREARDPLIRPGDIRRFSQWYRNGTPPQDPLASPLYGEFKGFPPILIHVGTEEVLFDDAVRVHEKALAAGVDSTCYIGEGLPHVWHYFTPFLPDANKALHGVADFLKARMA